jgi:hypothetical protein
LRIVPRKGNAAVSHQSGRPDSEPAFFYGSRLLASQCERLTATASGDRLGRSATEPKP